VTVYLFKDQIRRLLSRIASFEGPGIKAEFGQPPQATRARMEKARLVVRV
jgi:hypothetical protein